MGRVAELREPASIVVVDDVSWRTYSRLLRAFADHPRVRLTYDRGRLEIMPPVLAHEDDSGFLGRMVEVLTEEWELPIRSGGSTTLRRQLKQRGIEADRCFWIASAPRMKGRRRLDLRRDPPPDLAIEVDVSHSSLDRLAIYAVLRVPEIWRLADEVLFIYVLTPEEDYAAVNESHCFPAVTPEVLLQFLDRARKAGDQNLVVRSFRDWAIRHKPKT